MRTLKKKQPAYNLVVVERKKRDRSRLLRQK